MIAAAAVLGERRFDLVGEPQWIVAVIFDPGHWVVPDVQWSFVTSRRRPLNSGIGRGTGFEDFAQIYCRVTAQHNVGNQSSLAFARAEHSNERRKDSANP